MCSCTLLRTFGAHELLSEPDPFIMYNNIAMETIMDIHVVTMETIVTISTLPLPLANKFNPFHSQMLQDRHLKVGLDHITFPKLSPEMVADPDVADGDMVPQNGMIVECRPIESSPSVLEINVPQTSFTTTRGMDMKVHSVEMK